MRRMNRNISNSVRVRVWVRLRFRVRVSVRVSVKISPLLLDLDIDGVHPQSTTLFCRLPLSKVIPPWFQKHVFPTRTHTPRLSLNYNKLAFSKIPNYAWHRTPPLIQEKVDKKRRWSWNEGITTMHHSITNNQISQFCSSFSSDAVRDAFASTYFSFSNFFTLAFCLDTLLERDTLLLARASR